VLVLTCYQVTATFVYLLLGYCDTLVAITIVAITIEYIAREMKAKMKMPKRQKKTGRTDILLRISTRLSSTFYIYSNCCSTHIIVSPL